MTEFQNALSESFQGDINSGPFITKRQNVLTRILKFYFPDADPISKEYFDSSGREAIRRKKKIIKHRKLKKFFGEVLSNEQFHFQNIEDEEDNSVEFRTHKKNISFESDEGNLKYRRRKAEKLFDFFGDKIGLDEVNVAPTEQIGNDDFLLTINTLSAEKKAALIRKAKKLLKLLGNNVLLDDINVLQDASLSSESITTERVGYSMSYELSTQEQGDKIIQKQRLDKLSDKLGHRIQQADLADMSNTVVIRPLRNDEKKHYHKSLEKLERLFGLNVPQEAIFKYNSNDSLLNEEITESIEPESPLSPFKADSNAQAKKEIMLKLRILKKKFGVDPNIDITNTEAFLELKRSVTEIIIEESERQKFLDELETIAKYKTNY